MAEYIDKNDLREYISGYIKSCNGKPTYTDIDAMVGIISLLEQMPAADVQPIRKWISVNDKLPEEGIDVVVFCQYYWGKGDICKEIGISAYYGRGKWSKLHIPIDAEILYWQPMPDLPEAIKG